MGYERITDIEGAWIAPNAWVCGDVEIGENTSIWYGCAVRGDEDRIVIGCETNIQDNCVLHNSPGIPLTIGNRVTVGHACIIHGCTIGDETLVGMGAIIMDGAVIGKQCLIAAGALVTGGTVIPDGSLVMGSPAKIRRHLTPDEIALNLLHAEHYRKNAEKHFADRRF